MVGYSIYKTVSTVGTKSQKTEFCLDDLGDGAVSFSSLDDLAKGMVDMQVNDPTTELSWNYELPDDEERGAISAEGSMQFYEKLEPEEQEHLKSALIAKQAALARRLKKSKAPKE